MQTQNDITAIMRSYDRKKWRCWIEDILHLGLAWPISNFADDDTPEDVLVSMVSWLQQNDISAAPYEEAVAELLAHYQKKQFNAAKIDALLTVCIHLRSLECKDIIIRMLLDGHLAGLKNDDHYALTVTAIQALGAIDIKADDYKLIKTYIFNTTYKDFSPGIFTQSLYFFRSHGKRPKAMDDYFTFVTHALSVLDDLVEEPAYANAIMFELYGAALYRTPEFFATFFKWYEGEKPFNSPAQKLVNRFLTWADNEKDVNTELVRSMFEYYLKIFEPSFAKIDRMKISYAAVTRSIEVQNADYPDPQVFFVNDDRIFDLISNQIEKRTPVSMRTSASDIFATLEQANV
jgi:hypothetical protein